MLRRVRQSRRLLFLLGLAGWLILWTAYYAVTEAANPIPNLAAAIMCVLSSTLINVAALAFLLLTKLRWAALGYVAAIALNGVGLLLTDAFDVLYLVSSFPFFLPSNFRP